MDPRLDVDFVAVLLIQPDILKAVIAPPLMPCRPSIAFELPAAPVPSMSHMPHSPSASNTIMAFPPTTHLASTTDFRLKFPGELPEGALLVSDLLLMKPGYKVRSQEPNEAGELGLILSDDLAAEALKGPQS